MGLGNGNSTNGDKGSNYNFELKNLKGLQQTINLLAGVATEATLISVLNAIVASDQDLEILLVRDEAVGNGNPVLRQVTNWETGVPVITYENVDGTTYVPAPNPVPIYVYLDPSAVLNLILTEILAQGITLDAISTDTTSIAAEDFATETTLAGIKTQTDLLNFIATALEVNVSSSVLPTGASTEATLALLNAKFNSLGQKASAASAPVVLSTEQEAILSAISTSVGLGATEVTLLALNALITTIDAVLDAIKLDTVKLQLGTGSVLTNPTSSATTQVLKALNTNRKSLKIYNGSNVDLCVAEAATATIALFTWNVLPGEHIIIDDYSGVVSGISDGAPTGNILVTETTF